MLLIAALREFGIGASGSATLIRIVVFGFFAAAPSFFLAGVTAPLIAWIVRRLLPDDYRFASLERYRADVSAFEKALAEYEEWKETQTLEFWRKLTPTEFEHEFAEVLRKSGYRVTECGGAGDQGIDLIAVKEVTTYAVQCKKTGRAVGPRVVRELYGAMNHAGLPAGMLVSVSGFTPGVRDVALETCIQPVDLQEILRMCRDVPVVSKRGFPVPPDIGVQPTAAVDGGCRRHEPPRLNAGVGFWPTTA